jgi:hypothetical protein
MVDETNNAILRTHRLHLPASTSTPNSDAKLSSIPSLSWSVPMLYDASSCPIRRIVERDVLLKIARGTIHILGSAIHDPLPLSAATTGATKTTPTSKTNNSNGKKKSTSSKTLTTSSTDYHVDLRTEVKDILRVPNWMTRMRYLTRINWPRTRLTDDVYKSIAFQLGQCIGLAEGNYIDSSSIIHYITSLYVRVRYRSRMVYKGRDYRSIPTVSSCN